MTELQIDILKLLLIIFVLIEAVMYYMYDFTLTLVIMQAFKTKRYVIIEETYKLHDYKENTVETRFYPKHQIGYFFIYYNKYEVIDLMTTLGYKKNFCLNLEEAQEAIKKYIIFKKTKGIKVHKYKERKYDYI